MHKLSSNELDYLFASLYIDLFISLFLLLPVFIALLYLHTPCLLVYSVSCVLISFLTVSYAR
jgi:hypothetical protein